MKRKAVVILEDYVLENLIKHSEDNPEKECGGFLYGRISPIKSGVIHCYVTAIYSGYGIASTDNRFVFSPNYIKMAQDWGKMNHLQMIGFYHSHGIYKPIPSQEDLDTYNKFFPKEGLSIIYSPSYGIHADYICQDVVLIGNDIYIKDANNSYKLANDIIGHSNRPHKRR